MNIEEEIAAKIHEVDGKHTMGASALSTALMPLVKRAQAEAIREAAEFLSEKFQDIPAWTEAYRDGVRTDEWMQGGVRMTMSAIDVLKGRADQIENEGERA